MSRTDFVHLHTHSHYSLLEAIPKISELVAASAKDGQRALALTDNGNMYGAIEFYKACKKKGAKAICGVDRYLGERARHDKDDNVAQDRAQIQANTGNQPEINNTRQHQSDRRDKKRHRFLGSQIEQADDQTKHNQRCHENLRINELVKKAGNDGDQ